MGKAIVVRIADFSENKLDTVNLVNIVPCTSIQLSASTGTMTSVGSVLALVATVLPADTTDPIVWSTSDAGVATVTGGTVTQTGVGTVTITATCGQQTATCVITATHVVNFDTGTNVLTLKNAGIINDGDILYGTGPKSGTNGFLEWASFVNETGGYKVACQARSGSEFKTAYPEAFPCYAFKIPTGAATIRFSHPDEAPDKLFLYFIDSYTKSSASSEDSGKMLGTSRYQVNNVSGSYCDVTLADVTQAVGADSFLPVWYDSQQSDVTGWASGWTMTFSA